MNCFWIKPFLSFMNINYGKNLKLNGVPIIYNHCKASMTLGDNCVINSSILSNLIGLYSRTIIVTRYENSEVVIGDNVGLSGVTIYSRKKISIGNNTLIGGNTKIIDNDFHPIDYQLRNDLTKGKHKDIESSIIPSAPIIIGDNCFIGCNSIILKGTKIGNGCVVGAGSVVSGVFEDNLIIAGNPAKPIRSIY